MARIDPSHDPASKSGPATTDNKVVSITSKARRAPASRASGLAAALGGAVLEPVAAAAMARRLRTLDAHDPQRKDKAFRIFMSTMLAQQLGISDESPKVELLVERVMATMHADPELARDIEETAAALLGENAAHSDTP